jgi:hypothetical protein
MIHPHDELLLSIKRNDSQAHACNPSSKGLRTEGGEFRVSLNYIARPCLKREKRNEHKKKKKKNIQEP